ncbi:glycosyl hydrolase family 18 protein [Shimazuella kribbensis]|uniref:glycosyl hydrolase family 18 protein n=1 Tax=Shimazuella kribbensis TaxID=139808 RepID=UPI00042A6397|nr:glycosyl hydrolase family 18 protein [Shimazuella kribbensis]
MKKIYLLLFTLLLAACTQQSKPDIDRFVQQRNPVVKKLNTIPSHPEHAPPINDTENYQPIASINKPKIEVLGFLDPTNAKRATENVKRFSPQLTYIAFFSYNAKANGELVHLKQNQPLETAHKQNVTPMMVITNLGEKNYSPEIAHKLFTDPIASKRFITNIVTTMKQKGFRALNIDFEHMYEKDKKLYNGFLETLIPIVKQNGFLVSTDLAPKSSDKQGGAWAGAHDYAFHGKVADFVVLMTYDWAYSEGPPNPIAPTPEIRKILDYAVTKIPRHKIMMGFPLYGYDWNIPHHEAKKPAKIVSPQEAIRIAQTTGAQIQYDNKAEVPFFHYENPKGKQHEVWFENEQSAQAKFNLVKKYKLRGIGYWAISHRDFPRNWTLLEENFHIRKY